MNDKVNNIKSFFMAIVTVIVIYLICFHYSNFLYLTNDDSSIQNLLNGFTTGNNDPSHQFISIFLGLPLAFLYKIFPEIQWWFVYSQIIGIVGIVITNYIIYRAVFFNDKYSDDKSVKKFFITAIIVGVYNFAFAVPGITRTSFTMIPSLLGAAICMTMLQENMLEQRIEKKTIISCIGLVIIFFHRRDVGIITAFFLILAYYWHLDGKTIRERIRKTLYLSVVLVCILFSLFIIDELYKKSNDGLDFYEFNKSRIELLDYRMDTYEDNPHLYESVGWDENTYHMVRGWCFVDNRCNADSFQYIADNSTSDSEMNNPSFWDWYRESRCLVYIMILYAISAILVLLKHKEINKILVCIAVNLTAILAIGYQMFSGRILFRSIFVIVIYAVLFDSYIILTEKSEAIVKFIVNTLTIISLVCSLGVSLSYLNIRNPINNAYSDNDAYIYEYIIDHSNDFFVMPIDVTNNINPNLLFEGNISNSIYWGGSDWNSHQKKQVLEKNGIEKLDDTIFLQDDTYIVLKDEYFSNLDVITADDSSQVAAFKGFYYWMKELHPEYNLVKIENVCEGISIYQFQ